MSSDLKRTLQLLSSEKSTERKNACTRLKDLLNNNNVVDFLNKSCEYNVSWNSLFCAAKIFFIKEVEKLEEEERKKEHVSYTVLNNRNFAKKVAIHLPKLVLQKSCSCGAAFISCSDVTEFLFMILSIARPYYLEHFAYDALQLILKVVFKNSFYYSKLSASKWNELVKICIWLSNNGCGKDTEHLILEVFGGMVIYCYMHNPQNYEETPSYILHKIPTFLCEKINGLESPGTSSIGSSYLNLLLTLSKKMSMEWRFFLCKLGEDTFTNVLAMWSSKDSGLQDRLLEYFYLQLLLHYPQKDGVIKNHSEYCYNQKRWETNLYILYFLLWDFMEEIYIKLKREKNIKKASISESFIKLSSRLWLKIFSMADAGISSEIAQLTQLCTQSSSQSKRRKMEVIGFMPLVHFLYENGLDIARFPWYKILEEMLSSYGMFFDSTMCKKLLDLFSFNLCECRSSFLQEQLLNCLAALVPITVNNACEGKLNSNEYKAWQNVKDNVLRLLSGKPSCYSGYTLLQRMISHNLIIEQLPDLYYWLCKDTWNISSNKEALITLLMLLRNCPVPMARHLKIIKTGNLLDGKCDFYSLLLDCLLKVPNMSDTDSEASQQVTALLLSLNYPKELSDVLIYLLYSNSNFAFSDCDIVSSIENVNFYDELEVFLLMSSFSSQLPCISKFTKEEFCKKNLLKRKMAADGGPVLKRLFEMLNLVLSYHCEEEFSSIEVLINFSYIFVKISSHITANLELKECVAKIAEIIKIGLASKICPVHDNIVWDEFLPIISSICEFFALIIQQELSQDVCVLFYKIISADFKKSLETVLDARMKKSSESNMHVSFTTNRTVDDEFDMGDEGSSCFLDNDCFNDSFTDEKLEIIESDFLKLHGAHLDQNSQACLISLVKTFIEKQESESYGHSVAKYLVKLSVMFLKADPSGLWSRIPNFNLSAFLVSFWHSVKLEAASCVAFLFCAMQKASFSLEIQKERFSDVCQKFQNHVQSPVPICLSSDEENNKASTYLLTFAIVSATSEHLEKEALCFIIMSVIDKKFNEHLVQRVLERLAEFHKKTLKEYLNFYLPYLIHDWLKKFDIQLFPFKFLDCRNFEDFFQEYASIIIHIFFLLNKESCLQQVSAITNCCLRDLLHTNGVAALSALIPSLLSLKFNHSEATFSYASTRVMAVKQQLYYFKSIVGESCILDIFLSVPHEIALYILHMVYTREPLFEGEIIMEPYLDAESLQPVYILQALNHLGDLFDVNCTLVNMLKSSFISIHYVLLDIGNNLANSLKSYYKAKLALLQLEVFAELIFDHLASFNDSLLYIVKMLISICIYNLEDLGLLSNHLSDKCSHLLLKICQNIEVADSHILSSYSLSVVSKLMSIVDNAAFNIDSVKLVIEFFFNSESYVNQLGLLPVVLLSKQLQGPTYVNSAVQERMIKMEQYNTQSLEQYVLDFLRIEKEEKNVYVKDFHYAFYSVSHLFYLLKTCQDEMPLLYKKAYESDQLLAVSLTQSLFHILSTNADSKVAESVCLCLGELGPCQLGFPTVPSTGKNFSYDENTFVKSVISTLTEYLFSGDMMLVNISGLTLVKLLSTAEGISVFKTLTILKQSEIRPFEYEAHIGNNELWTLRGKFSDWVINLTNSLLKVEFGKAFMISISKICNLMADFCCQILPFLFYEILKCDNYSRRPILSKQVSFFLQSILQNKGLNFNNEEQSAVKLIINILDYLRHQMPTICFTKRKQITYWERNFWLDMDYVILAKCAFASGDLFSALLFVEIAGETFLEYVSEPVDCMLFVIRNGQSLLQYIGHHERGLQISEILLKIYHDLNDSDGVEACGGAQNILTSLNRATRNLHQGNLLQAFSAYDFKLSYSGVQSIMKTAGLYNILNTFSQLSESFQSSQAECAWRLGKWDDKSLDAFSNKIIDTDKSIYFVLKSLNKKDKEAAGAAISDARRNILLYIREKRLESTSTVYPILCSLQCLNELDRICQLLPILDQKVVVDKLRLLWKIKDTFGTVDYVYKEKLFAVRISALKALDLTGPISGLLHDILLEKCREACDAGSFWLSHAEHCLHAASELVVSSSQTWKLQLEAVNIAVAQSDFHLALRALQNIIKNIETVNLNVEEHIIYCTALNMIGRICIETLVESPENVVGYFKKSANILESLPCSACGDFKVKETYSQLAEFTDLKYREIFRTLSSEATLFKKQQIVKIEEDINTIKLARRSAKTEDEKKDYVRKERLMSRRALQLAETIKDLESHASMYLATSLEFYMKSLAFSSEYDFHIFRFIALWLQNCHKESVKQRIKNIKSHKFIPMLHQLVARMSFSASVTISGANFSKILLSLLERISHEHPHHALPIIMMIAHAHYDDLINQALVESKRKKEVPVLEEERVSVAKTLINKLKKSDIKNHVCEMEKICQYYIYLANFSYKHEDKKVVTIPQSHPILQLKDISHTCLLTLDLPVQPSGSYNPPLICSWKPYFELVGGINRPKKVTVVSSDGVKRSELLKGSDDIRQDAVLEQFFGIVNQYLKQTKEANSRCLQMRTYKALPLSQMSGLIQWCDNTQPFLEYLMEAHPKYFPNDYTIAKCYSKLRDAKTADEKLLTFKKYPCASEWYLCRRVYTHSLATSSMVGYIIGLGDRHSNNILIDNNTAELIHIDLGIAFETGHLLPTPEVVPFRMTQDVVAPLGVLGTEGHLQQNCRVVMEVLRKAKDDLLPIVEVLRHDPLHQWTVSKQTLQRIQSLCEYEIQDNEMVVMAESAIQRVREKLEGIEDGHPLSVSEQVSMLLQQATDISRLSKMYIGWKPYL